MAAKEKTEKTYAQINVSPDAKTYQLLDNVVKRFGPRHRSVRTRNGVVAEILELYMDSFIQLMEAKDSLIEDHLKKINSQNLPTNKRSK